MLFIFLGFNIWNVIFDFQGGLLSLIQLYLDCVDMNNYQGLLGNWAKLVLSFITLLFDVSINYQNPEFFRSNSNTKYFITTTIISFSDFFVKGIYFFQHYFLYWNNESNDIATANEEREFFYNQVEDNDEGLQTEFV